MLRRQQGRATGFPDRKALGADSANSGKGSGLGSCGLLCLKLKEEKIGLLGLDSQVKPRDSWERSDLGADSANSGKRM